MLQHVFDPTVCTCTCTCILIETHCVSSIIPNTSMYIVMSEKYRLIEIIKNRSTLHARALGPKENKIPQVKQYCCYTEFMFLFC